MAALVEESGEGEIAERTGCSRGGAILALFSAVGGRSGLGLVFGLGGSGGGLRFEMEGEQQLFGKIKDYSMSAIHLHVQCD